MASKKLRVSLPPLALLAALLAISLAQASLTDLLYYNDDNNYQNEHPYADHKQSYYPPKYLNKYLYDNNYQQQQQQQQQYPYEDHKQNYYHNKYPNNYRGNNYAGGDSQEYLDAHNQARSAAGVGPLRWDEGLAQQAYAHASQLAHSGCNLVHLGGPYGENLAMSGGQLSPAEAVQMWMDEKANYGYGGCTSGSVCGHFTQVVWRHSTSVGCAKAMCDNYGGQVVSCLYDPPGNVYGERPY